LTGLRHSRLMHRIILILAMFAAAAPALADIQDGVNALGRGNYPKALEIFEPLAESGDWNAQGFLAHTYRLMENNREAYAWYYATAKCGSKDAQIELDLLEPKLTSDVIEQGKSLGAIYYDRYCR
jgi:uncharacterized protein